VRAGFQMRGGGGAGIEQLREGGASVVTVHGVVAEQGAKFPGYRDAGRERCSRKKVSRSS
jgi:hypothetical protein